MTSARRTTGLGRGLSALLDEINADAPEAAGEAAAAPSLPTQTVATARIRPNPRQPRIRFDEAAQVELIDSVRRRGVLQPILVRPDGEGGFEIVAGERRWRAAQAAQLHEVPAVVRDFSDQEAFEVALVENIQREDLSPIEEARGYQRLASDFNHTQADIADMVGKSRSHVANLMRLLDLPDAVQDMVAEGTIAMGHARALIGTSDPERLAREIAERGLSARQAEDLSNRDRGRDSGRKKRRSKSAAADRDTDLVALEQRIVEATGLAVRLSFDGKGGSMTIRYNDLDQLDELVARLTGGA